ncbi:MAG TPA: UDP-N-acetylmuramate dehydrogenase [Steroidobacteraceae bacterium]|nr:UDP-N-acetylmuramate dehydrogenase [Steroidobacteraceae bacterium]
MRMHAASDMPYGGSRASAAALPIPATYAARVRLDEPMAAHCSWHAGGAAQAFFNPRDVDELAGLLRALPLSVPVYWVGLGTNLLVRDGGIRGVVIATAGAFTRIERRSASTIYCEASVPCARIARNCANWSLPQAEFFAGIPGSLGGALAMNAGAFGDETWRHVLSVETIDRAGQRRRRGPADYQVGYRSVALRTAPAEWFLSAELQFDPQAVAGGTTGATIAALMQRRRETQPLGTWSCGSVFKNPPGDHAGRLIESAGLKGTRVGDALVSEKHANFIINCGQARAADLEQLIRHVQATVQQRFGIALEPEVRIVGEQST